MTLNYSASQPAPRSLGVPTTMVRRTASLPGRHPDPMLYCPDEYRGDPSHPWIRHEWRPVPSAGEEPRWAMCIHCRMRASMWESERDR